MPARLRNPEGACGLRAISSLLVVGDVLHRLLLAPRPRLASPMRATHAITRTGSKLVYLRQAMEYRAVFTCIAGCEGEYDLEQPLYRCPKCGDLLQVTHDLKALAARSADGWKQLFDERYKRTEWPYGSAVWGKKEWVCPGVRNENIVSMDEGGTNLMWAERFGRELGMDELWIK